MILPTYIEPTSRGTAFGQVPNGVRASWIESTFESPKIGERWLVVIGSKDTESRCRSFVQRFAKHDAEIHFVKPSGPDSANEVRCLAIALEADWLCMVAERGVGLMSLFLRNDVAKILRVAPCPVICIPESTLRIGDLESVNTKANPTHRVLAPIKFPLSNPRQVENAVAVAERFEAKLDLLGADELLRKPEHLRTLRPREAKRLQIRALKKELSNQADDLVPNRMRGRLLVSVGFPLFYATTRSVRDLEPHFIVIAVPTRLWTSERRIDVAMERILHRVGCPVVCIPEHCELSTRSHKAVGAVRQQLHRDRHTPSRLSLRGPKCKDLSRPHHELFASTLNRKRFDAYET